MRGLNFVTGGFGGFPLRSEFPETKACPARPSAGGGHIDILRCVFVAMRAMSFGFSKPRNAVRLPYVLRNCARHAMVWIDTFLVPANPMIQLQSIRDWTDKMLVSPPMGAYVAAIFICPGSNPERGIPILNGPSPFMAPSLQVNGDIALEPKFNRDGFFAVGFHAPFYTPKEA